MRGKKLSNWLYIWYYIWLLLPDGIASSHSNPLWNRTILFQLFSQLGLNTEGLMGTLQLANKINRIKGNVKTHYTYIIKCYQSKTKLTHHGWSSQLNVQPEKEEERKKFINKTWGKNSALFRIPILKAIENISQPVR